MQTGEQPPQVVCACAITINGLPPDLDEIAAALGLLRGQFGATRDGAFQADLDVPAGFWRVWPAKKIALWIGRDPDQQPPLVHWQPQAELNLLDTVLRLGEHGIWLYEGRLRGNGVWSPSLPLKAVYEQLKLHPELFDQLSGEFGDSSGRSQQALISRLGCIEALSPAQAVRWLSIAYGLNCD